MPFGQIVLGPPASGKTTYCHGISQMLSQLGRRPILVNLDPANENLPYTPHINISDLVSMEEVMNEFGLGPNGSMLYCMEYLEKNMDWLIEELNKFVDVKSKKTVKNGSQTENLDLEGYFVFDFPGQVELYTHHPSTKNIIDYLSSKLNYRLCAVHLVDAHHCTDPGKYISMVLLSLKTMIQIELPHIHVLSKIDLIEAYGRLAFNLDYYTEVQDLSYLLQHLNADSSTSKYHQLNKALVDLIEDFSLVGFHTLCIEDKISVLNMISQVDKANGYIFGGLDMGNESIFNLAAGYNSTTSYPISEGSNLMTDIQEKYMTNHEEYDDEESV